MRSDPACRCICHPHHNRTVLIGMGSLFAVQVVVTAVCCGFFRGQGCIAGLQANWVGIYWVELELELELELEFYCVAVPGRNGYAAVPR
ncbi:hypothetical protein FB451DRAFT_1391056 [Mycena latifolia]|nr:hypothetical protein FB451DRAFT_1391056 [Mycena latifolia]